MNQPNPYLAFSCFDALQMLSSTTNTASRCAMALCRGGSNRCSFKTSKGLPCPNFSRHVYNDEDLCNIHLITVKSQEPCAICFEDMDSANDRVKLSCGHFFHKECLAQCDVSECPMCRKPLEPAECIKLYHTSKISPLMKDVYSFDPSKRRMMFDMIERVVSIAKYSPDDMDILSSNINSYQSHLIQFTEMCSVGGVLDGIDRSRDLILDTVIMTSRASQHMGRYGTYEGFSIHGIDNMLTAISIIPPSWKIAQQNVCAVEHGFHEMEDDIISDQERLRVSPQLEEMEAVEAVEVVEAVRIPLAEQEPVFPVFEM